MIFHSFNLHSLCSNMFSCFKNWWLMSLTIAESSSGSSWNGNSMQFCILNTCYIMLLSRKAKEHHEQLTIPIRSCCNRGSLWFSVSGISTGRKFNPLLVIIFLPSNADADAKTQLGHQGNLRHLRSILQIPHLADLDPIAGALLDAGCWMWGSPDLGDPSPIKLRDRVPMEVPGSLTLS